MKGKSKTARAFLDASSGRASGDGVPEPEGPQSSSSTTRGVERFKVSGESAGMNAVGETTGERAVEIGAACAAQARLEDPGGRPSSDALPSDALPSDALPSDDGAAGSEGVDGAEVAPTSQNRMTRVWRGWLRALASDPEAALAAALAYQRLDGQVRADWLDALQLEVESLGVPRVALYAPLLAVESDPARRRRIIDSMRTPGAEEVAVSDVECYALKGHLPGNVVVAILVEPLYLDFVQVLACAFVPGRELLWVRHDPIAASAQVPAAGSEIEGAIVEGASLRLVIDELATAVVAHRRERGSLPEALCSFAHLFGLECAERGQDFLDVVSS